MKPESEIRDIPGGLLYASLGECAVSVSAISPQTVTLRLPVGFLLQEETLRLSLFRMRQDRYEQLLILPEEYSMAGVEKHSFYKEVLLHIPDHKAFFRLFHALSDQYYRYIMAKLESCGNEFSGLFCAYPDELDDRMDQSLGDFMKRQKEDPALAAVQEMLLSLNREGHITLAKNICDRAGYEGFLKSGSRADRIYIGNHWCPGLFPDRELLIRLLRRAVSDGIAVTIVFSFMRQEQIERNRELLSFLASFAGEHKTLIEIVINDLGQLSMTAAYFPVLIPVLGPLLTKRRRDPRMKYKLGMENRSPAEFENSLDQEGFRKWLAGFHVNRVEEMSPGYEVSFREGICRTLYLPVYQTNTSQYCPLYALVKNKSRARQEEPVNCEKYCEGYVLAYPSHLGLFGRYNSLFAVDHETAAHREWIMKYLRQGVDRIVWNLDE